DAAAGGLEGDGAGDELLGGAEGGLEVVLEGLEEEAAVDELDPLAGDEGFKGVLVGGEDGLLEGAMGDQKAGAAGTLEDDPTLEADGGVAGIEVAADAVGAEHDVEAAQDLGAGVGLAVEADGLTAA